MQQLEPQQLIGRLEQDLSLPQGFVLGLVNEDDWSFVIKAHALVEASLAHLIASALAKPELLPLVARLDTSDTRIGKVAFAHALGVLDPEDRKFIRALSELRNSLVHNVAMVGFSLRSHVAAMDSGKFKSFLESFGFPLLGKPVTLDGRQLEPDLMAREHPRVLIWSGLFTVCGRIILRKTLAEVKESFILEALVKAARSSGA